MKNVPNILTIFRIISLPVLILMMLSSDKNINSYAVLLFIAIAASDFFDGYFARKMDLESSFGKMLDPIADKLFILAVIICLMIKGNIAHFSLIPGFLIIFREIFISGLREYYSSKNTNSVINVSYLGKIKTAIQMLSLFLILTAPISLQFNDLLNNTGIVTLWIAMIFSIISGYQYYKEASN
tara:strand:- start:375 stop:923 length:549 start_codon:yes stop_codon:yes gene_type:complete